MSERAETDRGRAVGAPSDAPASAQRRRTVPAREREGLARALLEVAQALLATGVRRLPPALVNRIIAACTLIALVCPLLLWISWSKAGFVILIAIAVAAVAIIYLLIWAQPDDPF